MFAKRNDPSRLPALPEEPVDRLMRPIVRFLHVEAAGGVVLLACTVTALVLANSPLADGFLDLWKTPIGLQLGAFEMRHSLQHWINDGLMAVFFFVIGLEVKREMVLGELRDIRRAALPIAAALGGMVVPAVVYLIFQLGTPGERGWGIPMATDIAFVVGCVALLGRRVPHSLRIMLLSLAIVDDIGAILVIAVGYTNELSFVWLGFGVVGLGAVVGLTRVGVRNTGVYVLMGTLVWLAFHESGVHATIAGVLLGLLTPARSWVPKGLVGDVVQRAGAILAGGEDETQREHAGMLRHVEQASREAVAPVERLETSLHPWVSFAIMPLFALANAGVPVEMSDLKAPVAIAVMAGLVVGKPLGILSFSWLAVKAGLASLPQGVGWMAIAGAGCLAGIGFTMALFIAGLALQDGLLDMAKVGVLCGSAISAVIGMSLLATLPGRQQETSANRE